MPTPKNSFKIDRKIASRLLKVSMRTVDRYIRAKKLSIHEHDGRIWLNKSQILKLRDSKDSRQGVDMSTPKMSIDKSVSIPVDMSIDNVHIVSTSDEPIKAQRRVITAHPSDVNGAYNEIYKKLFEELQVELKVKQERLEGANYRVGQLEALLKEAVPLLDHNRLLLSERAEKQQLQKEHDQLQMKINHVHERLKDEKLSKRVFLIFLFIIMLLQPLWLILSLKN